MKNQTIISVGGTLLWHYTEPASRPRELYDEVAKSMYYLINITKTWAFTWVESDSNTRPMQIVESAGTTYGLTAVSAG